MINPASNSGPPPVMPLYLVAACAVVAHVNKCLGGLSCTQAIACRSDAFFHGYLAGAAHAVLRRLDPGASVAVATASCFAVFERLLPVDAAGALVRCADLTLSGDGRTMRGIRAGDADAAAWLAHGTPWQRLTRELSNQSA